MSFGSPHLLALLGLVPLLVVVWAREETNRRRRLALLVDAGLEPELARDVSPLRRRLRRALAVTAVTLALIAAATPRCGGRTILVPQKGLDVLFVVDVSRSMRARDVLPDRLERAKAEIAAALPRFAEHRVGVVAFAGTAFVQCPLTTDKEAVRLFLDALAPESVPQGGTSLAAGLDVAVQSLRAESEARGATSGADKAKVGRVVVVMTDGEDHEGGIEDVAAGLKEEGATVVVIGVGSPLGEPIPVDSAVDAAGGAPGYLRDRAGNTVMTRMSPEVLGQVAAQVGGTFVDGTTQPDLGLREVEAKVAGLEKRDLEARTKIERVDRTSIFSGTALVFWLLALVLPERARWRRR
jgi:Ca-activated chloride channel family protein